MRTTIRMNPDLARRAKRYAAKTDRTFTQLIETAIARLLEEEPHYKRREIIVLPTSGSGPEKLPEGYIEKVVAEADEAEVRHILSTVGLK